MYADQIEELEDTLERIDRTSERQVLLKQLWRLRRRQENQEDAEPATSGSRIVRHRKGSTASQETVSAMMS